MRFSLLFLSTCALLLLNNGLHAQSNLHELVPYQGHELLDAPVSMDTIDVHKINLYCDWNTLEAMILDLEERIADALGEPVERDFYFSREVAGAKDYRMPDCYVLRDSVLSLQVQLDEALASEPGVMSLAVSDLAQRVATLHGRVFDDGNVPLEAWAFKFGLDSTLQDSVAVPFGDYAAFLATSDLDTGAFHLMLEDLDRYTTYFFTAVASNEEGAGYGDTLSFTTLPDLASGMVLSEENITANAALLRLTIADPGGQGPDSVEFFWGTTDHPSVTLFSSSAASDSIEGTDHSLQVTGLTRYTEYFYNAAADNLAGRAVVEANASFWTLPEPIQHDSIYYNSESGKIEALIADNGGQNIPDSYLLKKLVWDTLPTFPNAFEVPSNMYVFSANPNKQILKGTFSFDGREPGTYHYFNAWATNDVGTEYSDTLVVATPPATMTYNPGLPSSDWSPLELIVDSDCIWTEITPDGKFAVVNMKFAGSLVVSKPRFTVGTTVKLFVRLWTPENEPPNVRLCAPRSQLRSLVTLHVVVLRGAGLVVLK